MAMPSRQNLWGYNNVARWCNSSMRGLGFWRFDSADVVASTKALVGGLKDLSEEWVQILREMFVVTAEPVGV